MKYGFTLPGRGPMATPENLGIIARHGEELGYYCLMASDHIVVPNEISSTYPYTEGGEFPGSVTGESMEQLTVLAFLAGQTKTIRLGTSVMIVPHRNPVVTAKALATLDVLSQGRVIVGVGVGWMQEEFEALGLPPFQERGAVTNEYIRAFKELWTSDNPSFQGEYCSFSNISFLPKPVQKPHPPIWVGGESRPAIRRAAQLGNGWYPIGSNPQFPMGEPEALAAGMRRLSRQAEQAGRSMSDIDIIYRTHQYELVPEGGAPSFSPSEERKLFTGHAEEIAGDIRRYEEMGVSHMTVDFIRRSKSIDDIRRQMESLATKVWPLV